MQKFVDEPVMQRMQELKIIRKKKTDFIDYPSHHGTFRSNDNTTFRSTYFNKVAQFSEANKTQLRNHRQQFSETCLSAGVSELRNHHDQDKRSNKRYLQKIVQSLQDEELEMARSQQNEISEHNLSQLANSLCKVLGDSIISFQKHEQAFLTTILRRLKLYQQSSNDFMSKQCLKLSQLTEQLQLLKNQNIQLVQQGKSLKSYQQLQQEQVQRMYQTKLFHIHRYKQLDPDIKSRIDEFINDEPIYFEPDRQAVMEVCSYNSNVENNLKDIVIAHEHKLNYVEVQGIADLLEQMHVNPNVGQELVEKVNQQMLKVQRESASRIINLLRVNKQFCDQQSQVGYSDIDFSFQQVLTRNFERISNLEKELGNSKSFENDLVRRVSKLEISKQMWINQNNHLSEKFDKLKLEHQTLQNIIKKEFGGESIEDFKHRNYIEQRKLKEQIEQMDVKNKNLQKQQTKLKQTTADLQKELENQNYEINTVQVSTDEIKSQQQQSTVALNIQANLIQPQETAVKTSNKVHKNSQKRVAHNKTGQSIGSDIKHGVQSNLQIDELQSDSDETQHVQSTSAQHIAHITEYRENDVKKQNFDQDYARTKAVKKQTSLISSQDQTQLQSPIHNKIDNQRHVVYQESQGKKIVYQQNSPNQKTNLPGKESKLENNYQQQKYGDSKKLVDLKNQDLKQPPMYQSTNENGDYQDVNYRQSQQQCDAEDAQQQYSDFVSIASEQRSPQQKVVVTNRNFQICSSVTQTDPAKFVNYLTAFLFTMESMLNTMDPSEIQELSKAQVGVTYEDVQRLQSKKIDELRQCINKLRSIRTFSGDVMFTNLATNMVAKCVVPYDADFVLIQSKIDERKQRLKLATVVGGQVKTN